MMRGGVVLKLGGGKEVQPALGVVGAEDAEVRFDLLVSAFRLSVGLRMVGGGELDLILEKSG